MFHDVLKDFYLWKRKLGKYGADVSAIGIGAMSFSNFYGPTNEQESHTILAEALDRGFRI